MPVTAKLSRRFYEALGDDIANELVEWFNQVDATYRTDLRELNELNFQRFDAKMEQRLAQQDARWERRLSALEAKVERRLQTFEAKILQHLEDFQARIDGRLVALTTELEKRFANQDRRFAKQDDRFAEQDRRLDALDAKLDLRVSELQTAMADQKASLHRGMFRYWAATLVPLAALILSLHAAG